MIFSTQLIYIINQESSNIKGFSDSKNPVQTFCRIFPNHPRYQLRYTRLFSFYPTGRILPTAVQDGCRFPIRRGIRSFNAAHAAAVVPGCSVMPGAQVPLRFQLQGSSLFALPAAGTACVFRHAHRPVPCKSIPGRFTPE